MVISRNQSEGGSTSSFPGSAWERTACEALPRFAYKLDPDKTPRAIDFTFTEGKKKGRTDRGIYFLEGNNLKICIQENKDAPRPTDFTTRAGTDLSLVVLRRVK